MPSNKPIGSLPAAAALQDADLLVIEQSGEAKKLAGEHLKSYVIAAAETAVEGAVTPYIEEAEGYAETAESAKDIVVSAVDVAQQAETLAVQAKEDAQSAAADASSSKASAQTFAANAAASSSSASQASSDAHSEAERAKGYADQAAATHDGVASFNARSGNVMPQEGDYTPEMLGLEPMSEVISEGPGGGPGKNLFRTVFAPTETTAVGNTLTKSGITAVIQYDGSIKFSGTSTGSAAFWFGIGRPVEAADAITYSAVEEGDTSRLRIRFSMLNPAVSGAVFELPHTFTDVNAGDFNEYFYVYITSANYTVNGTVKFQKEHNAEATSWEPYPASVKIENAAEGLIFKELTTELPVKQEMNGYAKPWPGGGYKNYVPDGLITGASGTIADMVKTVSRSGITITSVNGKFIVNGSVSSGAISIYGPSFTLPAGTYYWSRWAPASLSATNNKLYLHYGSATKELNGSFTLSSDTSCRIEFFISAGITYNNDKCYCQIESGSTGTAFTPYENICPIIPHSAVEVTRTGKNLLDPNGYSLINKKFVNANTGELVNWGAAWNATSFIPIKAGTYTMSGSSLAIGAANAGIAWYDENYNYVGGRIVNSGETNYTFIVPTNGKYIRFNVLDKNEVQLELGSTATTYEAYNGTQYLVNIGINQWDEEWELGSYDDNTGEPTSATTTIRNKNIIPVIGGTDYYFKSPQNGVAFWYDASKTFISSNAIIDGSITAPANAYYMNFRMASGYGTTYNHNIGINYPSRFTEYYPYTGRIVFGGELDITTGVLTCTKGVVVFDGSSDETWQRYLSTNNFFTDAVVSLIKKTNNNTQWAVADSLNWRANCWDLDLYGVFANHSNGRLYFNFNAEIAADLRTWLAAHPIQVVYELATPYTIQLTPQQIKQLLGTNYLDAGAYKLSVTFRTSGIIASDDVSELIGSEKILTVAPMDLTKEDALQARLNIGASSNRNLLDNPFFQVNQRGASSCSNGYPVDRWYVYNATATIGNMNNGGSIKFHYTGSGAGFFQKMPYDASLIGKQFRLSVMFDDGDIFSATLNMPSTGTTISSIYRNIKLGLATTGTYHQFTIYIQTADTDPSIKATKLEYGSVSTLANDAPPSYQQELAKCQRYFTRVQATGFGFISVGYGLVANGAIMRFLIPLPTQMIKPTSITYSGNITVVGNGSTYTNSGSLTPLMSLPGGVVAQVTVTSTPTAGYNYNLVLASDAYLDLNADL